MDGEEHHSESRSQGPEVNTTSRSAGGGAQLEGSTQRLVEWQIDGAY